MGKIFEADYKKSIWIGKILILLYNFEINKIL